jgi:hypothetical protein
MLELLFDRKLVGLDLAALKIQITRKREPRILPVLTLAN